MDTTTKVVLGFFLAAVGAAGEYISVQLLFKSDKRAL